MPDPSAGQIGRPRRRRDALPADHGYDHDIYRRQPWQRGIRPVIARRAEPHGTGPGIFPYIVERTIAFRHGFRRLRIRWERRDDIREAFHNLTICLITHRHIQRLCQGPLDGACKSGCEHVGTGARTPLLASHVR
ncbi:hypothetical protein G3I23_09740 [Streptomyces sp. SID10115]|nr:hypothetical protein [Streptomyces sp. SID10115]NEA02869.1 hypothetical protein [Streptomyces sp. SID10116]NEB45738.1 hypothetical protein [Streptomyces sp. SID339]